MTGRKIVLASVQNKDVSTNDHIRSGDLIDPLDGERMFEYKLNDKAAKAKLVKSAKRQPYLLEENSTSSNLIFSVGSWKNVFLPAIREWSVVKDDQTCHVGAHTITIGSVKQGKESKGKTVDSKIIFFLDKDKVVCHCYNTTQLILVNGHGYCKFIELFLEPLFKSKIESCLNEIKSFNEITLEKLGNKSVKRSTVKYKGGTTFVCNRCDYAAKNISSLNKHKKTDHSISFNAYLAVMLRLLKSHPIKK